jgi:hypothetical protein
MKLSSLLRSISSKYKASRLLDKFSFFQDFLLSVVFRVQLYPGQSKAIENYLKTSEASDRDTAKLLGITSC